MARTVHHAAFSGFAQAFSDSPSGGADIKQLILYLVFVATIPTRLLESVLTDVTRLHMEFIWKKGVGFKVTVAPRFALVLSTVILALQAPDYLPRWFSILRAILAGSTI